MTGESQWKNDMKPKTIIGVDLGGTLARAGLVEDGRLGNVETVAVHSGGTEVEVYDQIRELIERSANAKIDGIGVGVPSMVDVERGIVYDVQNIPSWKQVPLKDKLEQQFGVPAYVNNDANCFAVGEQFFGKGRTHRNIVGLIIGTGLGAGLIINERLFAGATCAAGEFGMIPWNGQILEASCSGQFFTLVHNTTGEQLFRDAIQGSRHALDIYAEFGKNLGRAIEIILLSVDPDIIILGGSVSKSYQFFRDALWSSLAAFPYARTIERIRIEVSEVENIAILGAAALFYDAMGAHHPLTGAANAAR